MIRRVWMVLAAMLTAAMVAACGASKPHDRSGSGCESHPVHSSECAPRHPAKVGAPTPSGVVCSQTLNPGADVQSALSSASPGAVVCLNSGGWSAITLTSVAPASPGVTLAATPGETVDVPGFVINGSNTENVTVEGFNIQHPNSYGGGIDLFGGSTGGIVLRYDTIENIVNGTGIYLDPHYSNADQTGVTIEYTQMDHVGNGLEVDGNTGENNNITYSHNVMGPGLQDGEYAHYIQVGGVDGLTINNNAFIGPPDAAYENCNGDGSESHLNVMHIDGGQTNVTIDNNILWHTQACGQSLLLQNSPMDNINVNNNLDVEDPGCDTNGNDGFTYGCQSYLIEMEAPHTSTFNNNTEVNGCCGIVLGAVLGGGEGTYTDPNHMTAQDNVIAPVPGVTGQGNYGQWTCDSACTVGDNVSADSSVATFGGSGNIANWTPSWQNTTWTPVSGPGYQPPPAGYYQPTSLSIPGAGYQGQIGP